MEDLHSRLNPRDLDHFFVLEGGGPYAIGYEAGILDELRQRGADFSDAHMLGTSGGSWVGGMMLTDLQFNDVAGKSQIDLFNYSPDYLRGYADEVFGDKEAPGLNATATMLPFMQTRALHDRPVAELVTLSSSVPGLWFPGINNQGLWWDGAVGGMSAGYAHWAPRAETLVCVSALSMHLKLPVPWPLKNAAGMFLEAKTRNELNMWQRRNPMGKVIFIRPNEEIGNMVKGPGDIFDFGIAEDVYWMAREQMAGMIDGTRDKDPRASIGKLATDLCRRPYEPEPLAA